MKRSATMLRWLVTFTFLISILTPITSMQALAQATSEEAAEPAAQEPATGTLQIWVTAADTGSALGGAGFTVTDANNATYPVMDTDYDGLITVPNLPVGWVAAQQTVNVAGYLGGGYGETTIMANGLASITISNAPEPAPPPTPTPPPDADGDGITDAVDNCVNAANADQADADGDGVGDACDDRDNRDADGDGVLDGSDNCVDVPNPDQIDADGDGVGAACDDSDVAEPSGDADGDGIADATDNCAAVANPDQIDTDRDGQGDACDDNDDNDSHLDVDDNCPLVSNKNQNDRDGDGIGNACDDTDDSVVKGSVNVSAQVFSADDRSAVRFADVGTDILFEVTVTNASAANLTDVTITSDLNGLDELTCDASQGTLAKGARLLCTATYAVTEADAAAGELTVTFTVTAAAGEQKISETASVTFPTGPDPELEGVGSGGFSLAAANPNDAPDSAFADSVYSFSPGTDENDPCPLTSQGGVHGINGALGRPDWPGNPLDSRAPAIGVGGVLILEFTDNRLVPDGTSAGDLMILERGNFSEVTKIDISINGTTWITVGYLSDTSNAATQEFNIDGIPGVNLGDQFRFVRLTDQPGDDTNQDCRWIAYDSAYLNVYGPDIDAVWAISSANVTLDKTANKTTVTAVSETITYTYTIKNLGNITLSNPVVSDNKIPGASISCGFTTLLPAQTGTCTATYVVTTADYNAGTIVNTATATLNKATGGTITTNQDSWTVTVLKPNVVIDKTVADSTVTQPQQISFSIRVWNNGGLQATNAGITDTLPTIPGVTWSISGTPPTGCTLTGNTLTCTPRTLAANNNAAGGADEFTVTVVGTTTTASCGTFTNTANLTGSWTGSDGAQVVVSGCPPDLGITKAVNNTTINPGGTITYTITVTNLGPSTYTPDITISDQLPTGISWTESSPSWSCNINGSNVLTCSDDDNLPVNGSLTVTVTGTVPLTFCGTYTNTATITSVNANPNNDSASAPQVTVPCPDLSIAKLVNGSASVTVDPGAQTDFTITVTNNGPGTYTPDITVTDTLPVVPGLTWAVQSSPNWDSCTITSGVLTCTDNEDLANGGTLTVTVRGTVPLTYCGSFDNFARLTSTDTNASNNTSATVTVTVRCPDITVQKTPDGGTVNLGQVATFSILVTNNGPGSATAVTLTDTLPAGTWTVSTTAGTCPATATGTLSCSFGTLAAGQSVTVTVSRATTSADCGLLTNSATVDAANDNAAGPLPNTDAGTITVNCADVAVTKVATTPSVGAGQLATYTITLTTSGNAASQNVRLTDALPAGFTIVSATRNPGTNVLASCTSVTGNAACDFGTLPSGTTIMVVVQGTPTTAQCGPLPNTANVSATNDTNSENNSSSATITVSCPNVAITKVASAATVNAGDPVTFTVTVTNTSTVATATNVGVNDPLPAGISWSEVAGSDPANRCSITGGVLTCEIPSLAPSSSYSVQVTGLSSFAQCAGISNTATVTAAGDTNADDNQATATVAVNCPDLSIAKLVNSETSVTVDPGTVIDYTITVTNNGPGTYTPDITVTDDLPVVPGLTWTVQSAPNWDSCTITDGDLSCTDNEDLAEDGSLTITVRGTVPLTYCGTFDNSALLTSSDTNAANNTSGTVTVTVNCPDITVSKVAKASPISTGDEASFTIVVRNDGPGTATDVTLTDTLPDTEPWDVTTTAGTCDTSVPGTVTCEFGDLVEDGTVTITVSRDTTSADCAGLTNSVLVEADNETDATDQLTNTASASITVQCSDLSITKVADDAVVNAGEQIGYTITVTNSGAAGTGNAYGVTLEDVLPTGPGISWSIVAADTSENCTISPLTGPTAQTVTCAGRTLAPGQSIMVHVVSQTTGASCGLYENTASYRSINAGVGESTKATITVLCPDVVVTKEADEASVLPGGEASFLITVTNNGPGLATGVTVSDVLPDGVTWSIVPPVQGCAITTDPDTGVQTLDCHFASLADDASVEITVSGTVPLTFCGPLTNQMVDVDAENEADTGDAAANNTAPGVTITVPCPDITVVKTPDGTTIGAGQPATFNIIVTNNGPGTATGVTLTDTLPNDTDWLVTAPDGVECTYTQGTDGAADSFTCDIGDLEAGAGNAIDITVSRLTTSADCGLLTNTASVSATNETTAIPQAPNTDAGTITVQCADVTITKEANANAVNAGDPITYTITVTNTSLIATAFDVAVNDTLPPGIAWSEVGDNPFCSVTPGDGGLGGTLTCSNDSMPPNTFYQVQVRGTTSNAVCGPVSNTARISADRDTNLNNNSATADVTVNCPDITVTKVADEDPVNTGDTISFLITVRNDGLGTAYDVELEDLLPGGIAWSADNAACEITGQDVNGLGGTLTCDFDSVPDGESRSVTISGEAPAGLCDTVNNTAEVTASNEVPNDTLPNEASDSVTVQCAGLTITKEADDAVVGAGEQIGFTITIENLGPGTAYDVELTDSLPGGPDLTWTLEGTLDDPIPAGCSIANNLLTCEGEGRDLDAGDTLVVHVVAETTPNDCATYDNTATYTSSNAGTDWDDASIQVVCPDVEISKLANGEAATTVTAGDQVTFTITVRNLSTIAQAFDVVITDELPDGVAWEIDPAVTGCSIDAAGDLTCNVGTLAINNGTDGGADEFTVTVTGTTSNAVCNGFSNTAEVTADGDTNDGNDRDTASVTVNCPDITVEKSTTTPTINPGQAASFTIEVTNLGPGTAYDVELTDVLPAGVVWEIDPAVTGCAITGQELDGTGGTLACDFDTLAVNTGTPLQITVTGTVPLTFCGPLTNPQVSVSAENESPTGTAPNTAGPVSIAVNCPDIKVEKTPDEAIIGAGQDAVFTITVTNLGPGTATGVALSDTMPDGTDWTIEVISGPVGVDCDTYTQGSPDTFTCEIGELAEGETVVIEVRRSTTSVDCGLLENSVSVSATNEDRAKLANNSDTGDITVECADVEIAKLANNVAAATVSAGDEVTFTIAVENLSGTATAYDVDIRDELPDGVDWATSSLNCTISDDGADLIDQVLECLDLTLIPNQLVTVVVTGTTSNAVCGPMSNTATVTADRDTDLENNDATATVQVNCPDISVTKVADTTPISAGDEASFTIVLTNNGPGTAYDVELTDALPAGVAWEIDPAVTGCAITDGTLSCSFDTLAVNTATPVQITVTGITDAADCGPLPNSVEVEASNEDLTKLLNNDADASITVNCPDVKVVKTATGGNGTIAAGETLSFTIVVSNVGAGIARDVTLTDTLDPAFAWTIDPAVAGCEITGQDAEGLGGTLECDFDDIAPGAEPITIIITAPTSFEQCETVTNLATVDATNEANTGTVIENNESSAQVVINCSSLSSSKTPLVPVVNAGDQIGFTISVTNNGDGAAFDVVLTDELPDNDGLDWSVNPAVDGCAITTDPNTGVQTLTCTIGTLAAGDGEPGGDDEFSVIVTSPTTADSCAVISNTAVFTSSNAPQSTAIGTVTVECPDVTVEKTAVTTPINTGDTIAFDITVRNIGDSDAYNVVVTDILPAIGGATWSVDSADCEILPPAAGSPAGTLRCTYEELPAGGSDTVRISATAPVGLCAPVRNDVSVTASNEPSGATGNNSDFDTVVVNCPDLDIEKTTDTPSVNAGDQIGFTITLTNEGLGTAYDVVLTDTLPTAPGVSWSIVAADTSADCTIDPLTGPGAQTVTCTERDLAPDGEITVHVTSDTTAASCTQLPNTSSYTSRNAGSDSASATITVLCPDLEITKRAASGTINAGDEISFTIEVENTGAGDAYDVEVTDDLPAGIVWSIQAPVPAGCAITGQEPDGTGGTLTCDFGTIPAGGERSVMITGIAPPAVCGPISNTASVEGSNEPDSAIDEDNSDTATVTVNCPDVEVAKTADEETVSAGDEVSFTILVENLGPGTAYGVDLTDDLPDGIAWTVDPAVDGCEISDAGVLTCDIGDLAAGEDFSVTVTGTTDAEDCRLLENSATATASNEASTATGNNTGRASITVLCPDVTVTKSTTTGIVNAGDDVSFTILVSNTGAGDAYGVTVEDELPDGVVWTIDPAVQGCEITDGTLECDLGTLAADASVSITVKGTTDPADCGTLDNSVTVSATNEARAALGNNRDDASITVNCPDVTVTKAPTNNQGTVNAGDPISFTITVTNIGLGTAYDVEVIDLLPAGFAWSIVPAVAGCEIDGNTLECELGDLAPQASVVIIVTSPTDFEDCGVIRNTASVSAANEPEGAKTNNQSTATIAINCSDILVTKTPDAAEVNAGDQIGFTIEVENTGDGAAYNVVLTDPLPTTPGLSWTIDPAVDGCEIAGGILTCEIGTLASGESFEVHIESPTTAASCTTINNLATATSSNAPDATGSGTITVLCPNVTVEKTAASGTVNTGDPVSFTMTVRNTGQGDAYGVVLTDALPAGIAWTIDPAVQGCEIENGTLTCEFGTIPASQSRTVTVRGIAPEGLCTTISNTARVTATNEPASANTDNSSTATITINCPDLEIEKTADNATVNAGDEIGFTITLTNTGDGTAYDVILSDTLPTALGVAWSVDTANSSAGCTITGNTLTCTERDLAPGASITVHVVSETSAESCTTLTNSASYSSGNAGSDTSDPATVTIACPDLEITKTAADDRINAGDPISFTITVTNDGPGDAYDVVMTDDLPAGIAWAIDPEVDGCSITDGTLTCDFGTIPAEENRTVTITGTAPAAVCGTITNTALVEASNEPGLDDSIRTASLENNEATATVIVDCPDLVIEKTAANSPISAGDTASFTIMVENLGPGTAYDVVVTDTLPAGVAWTETSDDCSISAGGVLTCDFGDLADGDSASVTVSGPTDPTDCGVLNNTATARASNEAETDLGNNTDSATITVNCPDLVIEKSAAADTVNAGDLITFTITVTNSGLGDATGVVVTDELPDGIVWTEGSTACEIVDGTLTCDFGTIPAGQSRSVTVSGTAPAAVCGEISNTASVIGTNESTDDTENNESTAVVTVDCPDLQITKTATDSEISAGDTASFTILVENLGPGTAYDVVVTDTLPAGIVWTDDSGDCEIEGGVLTCDFGDLADGATASVTVSGETDAGDCSILRNTASVTAGNEPDDLLENNSDSATITVDCPDVEVDKTTTTGAVGLGDTASFTITVMNVGAGTAYDVVVTDDLPDGIAWSIAVPVPAGCAITDGTLTCEIDELAADAGWTVTITGQVPEGICGQITNTVSVEAGNEGTDVGENNTDIETIFIECPGIEIAKSCPVLQTGLKIGDSIVYTVTIRNTGNVPLTGIEVTESRTGEFSPALPTELAVGETYIGTFTTEVTADDAAAGMITNVFGVETAEGPSDTATADCPLTPGTVTIFKYTIDRDGNEVPMADVCFSLRQGETTVYGPACTGADGIARFEGIKLGTYRVVEVSTPPGYVPAEPLDVTVGNNETVGTRIVNIRGTVGFPVYKLDCQTDPGEVSAADLFADPTYAPDGCIRVPGVAFDVTIDGEPLPNQFVTSADGSFAINVQVFSSISVTEDLTTATPGFLPRESTITIDNVPADGTDGLVFVNLAQDGHLRLIKYVCKTDKPTATRFEIADPTGITLAGGKDDRHETCWRGANVAFSITGGQLSDPLKVTTDRNGELTIGLRAGDYTIVEDATGATATFTVIPTGTTVIKVTNYTVPDKPTPTPTPQPTPVKPAPEPVRELPDTGSGSATGGMSWLMLLLTLGFGGLATASLLALSLKRHPRPRKSA